MTVLIKRVDAHIVDFETRRNQPPTFSRSQSTIIIIIQLIKDCQLQFKSRKSPPQLASFSSPSPCWMAAGIAFPCLKVYTYNKGGMAISPLPKFKYHGSKLSPTELV